jgi:hypothetical protein
MYTFSLCSSLKAKDRFSHSHKIIGQNYSFPYFKFLVFRQQTRLCIWEIRMYILQNKIKRISWFIWVWKFDSHCKRENRLRVFENRVFTKVFNKRGMKIIFSQLMKKFSDFHKTLNFITLFTTALQWVLSQLNSVHNLTPCFY